MGVAHSAQQQQQAVQQPATSGSLQQQQQQPPQQLQGQAGVSWQQHEQGLLQKLSWMGPLWPPAASQSS